MRLRLAGACALRREWLVRLVAIVGGQIFQAVEVELQIGHGRLHRIIIGSDGIGRAREAHGIKPREQEEERLFGRAPRAFALGSLLRECGVPVTKVATRRPGTVLYRDPWQIVANPEAATPTTWH